MTKAASTGQVRPCNVLVLLSDEQDALALGGAGHPWVHTPHLDALAARGTRFTRALTPSPICVPARASLATGRWVHQIGYWDNAMGYDGRVPGWGHALMAAGHRVESIGKLHYANAQAPTGFSRQHEPLHLAGGIGQVWGSVRDPLPDAPRPSRIFDELGPGESRYNRYDQASAERAAQWLAERAAQPDPRPWALFVGFVAPHFPLVVPPRHLAGIPIDALPLPRLHPREGTPRHPWVQRFVDFTDDDAALGTDARRRLALACYYGLVNFLDERVGVVLDALHRLGLAGDTLVIFSSDHGDNQGVRGLWNKSMLYRESTAVPLLVAGPGMPEGHACGTQVNLVDLAPTITQAIGVPPAAGWAGRALQAVAAEADDPARIGFSEYHAVGSPTAAYLLRQGPWSYHHYVGYRPELFDQRSDPGQARNLAGDAVHAAVVAHFEALLRERLDPEATDRRAKADQKALVARFGGRDQALRTGPVGASPVPGHTRP
ncbi:MAG: sulfatase-like hydrolase/transferase [Burkholderiales bacterium]|nr:sulfatase-like hydrolase/transferase [Burkholderiales bacterium]